MPNSKEAGEKEGGEEGEDEASLLKRLINVPVNRYFMNYILNLVSPKF
jgi:hypothetical protein